MDRIQTWLAEAQSQRRDDNRPLVTLSYAQSLDGCIAMQRGQPTALSGSESLKLTHRLRASHTGILVGIGTVLADNPRLDVRLAAGKNPQPVVLDSRLRTPPGSRLLAHHRQPWIAHTPGAPAERRAALESVGARLLEIPADSHGQIHLPALLDLLVELGIDSLMVEGGAQVISSFLASRLVDQLILTIAPRFLAGVHAPENWTGSLNTQTGTASLGGAGSNLIFPRLKTWQAQRAGDDLILWGIPDWELPISSAAQQILKETI